MGKGWTEGEPNRGFQVRYETKTWLRVRRGKIQDPPLGWDKEIVLIIELGHTSLCPTSAGDVDRTRVQRRRDRGGGGARVEEEYEKTHPLPVSVEFGLFDNNDIAFATCNNDDDDDDRHNRIRFPRYCRVLCTVYTLHQYRLRPLINKRRRVRGAIINYSVVKGRVRPTRVFYKFHFPRTPLAPHRRNRRQFDYICGIWYMLYYIYIYSKPYYTYI